MSGAAPRPGSLHVTPDDGSEPFFVAPGEPLFSLAQFIADGFVDEHGNLVPMPWIDDVDE